MVTIADVEQEIVRRIEALDPTDFRGTRLREVWHENEVPLTAVADSEGLAHLAFSVSVENCPAIDDGQSLKDGYVDVLADLVVIFVYKIAASTKTEDYRLASEAARRVLSAILQPYGEALILPRQVFKPGIIRDGYMPVELRFAIHIELPV